MLIDRDGRLAPATVTRVSLATEKGVFAPLTDSGNLVVDGVLASAYAVVNSQTVAHAAFGPVRWWNNVKQNARHWSGLVSTISPVRTMLGNSLEQARDNSRQARQQTQTVDNSQHTTGVHWYPNLLFSLASYVLPTSLFQ